MEIDYGIIGENIKLHRKQQGLKQQELAELVGVSEQHISHIECARTQASLPVLIKICNALNADIYWILGSNLQKSPHTALTEEIESILGKASPLQRMQCVEICKIIVGYDKNH